MQANLQRQKLRHQQTCLCPLKCIHLNEFYALLSLQVEGLVYWGSKLPTDHTVKNLNHHDSLFFNSRLFFSAVAQSWGSFFATNKKLIIDGTNINVVTVMAYLIDSISPLFDLNTSINHPVILGPKPKPIMFKIKKKSAVDMARIWIGAKVWAIAKLGPKYIPINTKNKDVNIRLTSTDVDHQPATPKGKHIEIAMAGNHP